MPGRAIALAGSLALLATWGCQPPATPAGAVAVVPTSTGGTRVRLVDAREARRRVAALPASWDQAQLFFDSPTAKTAVSNVAIPRASFDEYSSAVPPYVETRPSVVMPVNRPAPDYVVAVDLHTAGTPHVLRGFGWVAGQLLSAGANSFTVPILNNLATSTPAGSGASGDGVGTAAMFNAPARMDRDASGNLYVADFHNHRIRMVAPDGTVTTFAGSQTAGYWNDYRTSAVFNQPAAVAFDATYAFMHVADYNNNRIRRIDLATGAVSTLAGSGSYGYQDAAGASAQFSNPADVAVDASGNVYVADRFNHCVRKIDTAGNVTTLAGNGASGFADGSGTAARFNEPTGLAVDRSAKLLYVADSLNHCLRQIELATGQVTTIAGSGGNGGYADGTGTAARFAGPIDLDLDATATTLFVADFYNNKLRRVSLSTGGVTTLAGGAYAAYVDATGTDAYFAFPQGIAVAGSDLYVADRDNHALRRVDGAAAVTTFAGGPAAGATDDVGASARFRSLTGMAVDAAGSVLYMADYTNHRIRRLDLASGAVTTLAGSGWAGSADGAGTAAAFNHPYQLALAGSDLYVADSENRMIRKIDAGGNVTTLAGSGYGYADGVGAAARFTNLTGIAVDAARGVLYVADIYNHCIRKLDLATNAVTTFAGSPGAGGYADGTGTAARFNGPWGLGIDRRGNLYVGDHFNYRLRKISPEGVVTTVAGDGGWGYRDGAGTAARFSNLAGLVVDAAGNVHVADVGNSAIRKVAPDGYVTTVVGNGPGSWGHLEGTGQAAKLSSPVGVAVDAAGTLYVADRDNHVVRRIK